MKKKKYKIRIVSGFKKGKIYEMYNKPALFVEICAQIDGLDFILKHRDIELKDKDGNHCYYMIEARAVDITQLRMMNFVDSIECMLKLETQ